MIITEEKVNTGYQKEFDVLKAFAIFFMIAIHIYEELSEANLDILCNNAFDTAIQFLGGPMAAPVFMFALGIGLSYSRHRTPKDFINRGVKLLIFSYLYNIVRFTIPCTIEAACTTGIDAAIEDLIYETFHIDILTFAAWAFILTGLLKKKNIPVIGMVAIAIAMQVIGIVVSSCVSFNSLFSIYFFGGFVPTGEPSYFPLFLWYIYPMLGLLFAKYLRHITDTDKLYAGMLAVSVTCLASICATLNFIGYDVRNLFTLMEDIYYCQTLVHVLFNICCIFSALAIVHFVMKVVHWPKLEEVIKYLSSNLNNIYIVQWIIIGWTCSLVIPDRTLPLAYIVPMAILIMAVSCGVVLIYQKATKRKNFL